MKRNIIIITSLLVKIHCFAQNVGISATGTTPNASAMLDIVSTNKGLLIPRLALSATNSNAPIGAGIVTSLLVYNTATAGSAPNNVVPGYYYWNGSVWIAFADAGLSWTTLGNAGTVDGTNFIGTTDNVPFNIRVNNDKAGRIDPLLGNTFWGYKAGNFSSTENSFFGHNAGYANTGQTNAFFGYQAGYTNTTGSQNCFYGARAGLFNSTGPENSFFGVDAGQNTTIGDDNSFFGFGAGRSNLTGVWNTCIGAKSDVTPALTNASAIGYGANVNANNNMVFGNGSVVGWGFGIIPGAAAIRVGSNATNGNGATLTLAGVWTNASDSTKKWDINPISYGLKDVLKLHPVSYKMKQTNIDDIGFLAQEVKNIIPEIVYGDEGQMTMSYGQLTAVLTKAIQEQQQLIENLILENKKLKSVSNMRISKLEAALTNMENMMQTSDAHSELVTKAKK